MTAKGFCLLMDHLKVWNMKLKDGEWVGQSLDLDGVRKRKAPYKLVTFLGSWLPLVSEMRDFCRLFGLIAQEIHLTQSQETGVSTEHLKVLLELKILSRIEFLSVHFEIELYWMVLVISTMIKLYYTSWFKKRETKVLLRPIITFTQILTWTTKRQIPTLAILHSLFQFFVLFALL